MTALEDIEITPKHLAVLIDISPIKAVGYFERTGLPCEFYPEIPKLVKMTDIERPRVECWVKGESNFKITPAEQKILQKANDELLSKFKLKDWRLPLSALAKSTNINLTFILADVKKNFCKNRQCVDYTIEAIKKKIKKNDMGFWPLSITLPKEISWMITDEQREKLREMILAALKPDLTKKQGNSEYVIKII